jgi:hypothetical protein
MREIDDPLLQVPPCSQGEPNPCAVPLAKRGEPTEGGAIRNFGCAIGTTKRRESATCLPPSHG